VRGLVKKKMNKNHINKNKSAAEFLGDELVM